MSHITLDQWLRAKICDLDEQVAICDETGRTVGYYVPAQWHREMVYAWAKQQFTDEELEMARKQTGSRPLQEVLADLEKQ